MTVEDDYENWTLKLSKHPNVFQQMIYQIDTEIFHELGVRFACERYIRYIPLLLIYDIESLVLAVYVAASGFRHRKDTQYFMTGVWKNSYKLCEAIHLHKFKPKYYKKRHIHERGKAREIRPPHFDCKVGQKVICNIMLRPTLTIRMISTNFGSVSGRGTDALYERVLFDVNRALSLYGLNGVLVITDFSAYFASIDRDGRLYQMYLCLFTDDAVAGFLIQFDAGELGLTLGNETSQIPASAFVSGIDHYFKDCRQVKIYDRYMDDTLAGLANDANADFYIRDYKALTDLYGLTVKPEKIKKVRFGEDFTFCKQRYLYSHKEGRYYMLPNPERFRRFERKWKHLIRKGLDAKLASEFMAEYMSLCQQSNSRRRLRQSIMKFGNVMK